jgi:hypothetical protein
MLALMPLAVHGGDRFRVRARVRDRDRDDDCGVSLFAPVAGLGFLKAITE